MYVPVDYSYLVGGIRRMSNESGKRFLDIVCEFAGMIRALFALCLLFLLVTIASLFVLSPGTASYVVAQLNLAGLIVFTTVFGLLARRCGQLEEEWRR